MRFVLGVLPLLTFLVWTTALYLRDARLETERRGLRRAILQAAALFGLWVVVGTEGLSAISQLKFVPILLWWIIALAAGAYTIWRLRQRTVVVAAPNVHTVDSLGVMHTPFDRLDHASNVGRGPGRWLLPGIVGLVLFAVLGLAFTSALLNPPNNYDSYSYHLPRQVFWLQHANVRFYPTNNLRQLMMAPLTEFVGVHLMALSNSDRWINLVQFAALLVTFCGVSLLTERLGGDRPVQLFACLILLVSPIVFMESSNTKNDIVVAMWIVICTCWLVRVLDGISLTWFDALLFGSAIGCAADTKGTGPLFVIPIVIVLCIAVFRRFTAPRFKMLCAMGLLALAINLPQFGRNYFAFGHIDGPTPDHGGYPLYNNIHTPNVVLSNTLRLLAWHATIDNQPFNDTMYHAIVWLHDHVLHLDVNDKRTTTPFSAYNGLRFYGTDEDRAGSPAHVLMLLLLPVALVLARKGIDMHYALLICAIAVTGFVIFNWSVKWQEWHVRYFIPQTALFAPVLAIAFTARWRGLVLPVLTFALAWSLLPTIEQNPRRLFGPGNLFERSDLSRRFTYYGKNHEFMQMAKLVGDRQMPWVGFATNGDFPDYAVMYTIKYRTHHLPDFEYVNPYVKIAGYAPHHASLIIADVKITSLTDKATGDKYVLYRSNSFFNVLLPPDDPALLAVNTTP